MSRWRDWAQLLRVPNTFTACADSVAGFSLCVGPWFSKSEAYAPVIVIGLASIALYWAGMVLNDVNDVERDKAQRRFGPLVVDRISVGLAQQVGWTLLAAGIMVACFSGWLREPMGNQREAYVRWLPGAVAFALAMTIKAYDSPLKQTWIGPWLMGLCRSLNFLLGIATGCAFLGVYSFLFDHLSPGVWMIVGGHGLFVVGLTLAARKESMAFQSRRRLASSWLVSLIGVILIAFSVRFLSKETPMQMSVDRDFPIVVCVLCLPWAFRVLRSVRYPNATTLVPAIKQTIMTIIFLDASLALQFAGTGPGFVVCLFAVPTFLMGQLFRMT